jgi:hypothetical protein
LKLRVSLVLAGLATVGLLGVGVPAASATTRGIQHFVAVGDGNGAATVTAVGPISAVGKDVVIDDTHDRFVFPKGSVRVHHVRATDHSSFDPTTCTFTYTEVGSYTVSGGRGAYATAHGSGTYNVLVVGHGCNPNKPPDVSIEVIEAAGPLTIG